MVRRGWECEKSLSSLRGNLTINVSKKKFIFYYLLFVRMRKMLELFIC